MFFIASSIRQAKHDEDVSALALKSLHKKLTNPGGNLDADNLASNLLFGLALASSVRSKFQRDPTQRGARLGGIWLCA